MSQSDPPNRATRCVHAGWTPDDEIGAVNPPIYATSTYAYRSFGEHTGWEYSRTGNPTRRALETAMAELEGGADAAAFGSGLAAIAAITELLEPGGRIVASDNLYGGTVRLFRTITAKHGHEVCFADTSDPASIPDHCSENTKLVFVETPTNPLMRVVDIDAAAEAARRCGALLVVDNTFLTPMLQHPFEHGADIVVHSTTKYLNGHSDGVGGVAIAKTAEVGEKLRTIQNNSGGIMGPFDAYLVIRGLRTLAVRMRAHETNGGRIAELLAGHDAVERVLYPGLPDHPGHEIAARQQEGFGAMVSFDLGSLERAAAFCNAVETFLLAESLGGVESLVCHPATMTHASVPEDERRRMGLGDGLVRLSVGIEDGDDLIADVERGLKAATTA